MGIPRGFSMRPASHATPCWVPQSAGSRRWTWTCACAHPHTARRRSRTPCSCYRSSMSFSCGPDVVLTSMALAPRRPANASEDIEVQDALDNDFVISFRICEPLRNPSKCPVRGGRNEGQLARAPCPASLTRVSLRPSRLTSRLSPDARPARLASCLSSAHVLPLFRSRPASLPTHVLPFSRLTSRPDRVPPESRPASSCLCRTFHQSGAPADAAACELNVRTGDSNALGVASSLTILDYRTPGWHCCNHSVAHTLAPAPRLLTVSTAWGGARAQQRLRTSTKV